MTNHLFGIIPTEVLQLRHLKHLMLYQNNLHGPILETFAPLSSPGFMKLDRKFWQEKFHHLSFTTLLQEKFQKKLEIVCTYMKPQFNNNQLTG